VWLIADHVGLSAIITVVSYAMTIGQLAPGRIDARHRISSYAVWEAVVFILNVLAFVLIGLQLRTIVTRMRESDWHTYANCAGAVSLAVILVRVAWIMPYGYGRMWRMKFFPRPSSKEQRVPRGAGLVVSWAGMRGIVTIAAALALPDGSPE